MNLEALKDNPEPTPPDTASGSQSLKATQLRTKRELRRHHVSERDHLVADALCDISFGMGLTSVKIPKLETLGDLIGLPRQHVFNSLQRLHEMRIVTVRPKEGVYVYTINPNSETWKVMPRVALATVLRATDTIRELNGVPVGESEPSENSATNDPRQLLLISVTDSVTVTNETFPYDL